MQHLFFDCLLARSVRNSLLIAFILQPPIGTPRMFCVWIRSFPPSLRDLIIVGLAAICMVLWLNRNDVVFNRNFFNSCVQVIFMVGQLDQTLFTAV